VIALLVEKPASNRSERKQEALFCYVPGGQSLLDGCKLLASF